MSAPANPSTTGTGAGNNRNNNSSGATPGNNNNNNNNRGNNTSGTTPSSNNTRNDRNDRNQSRNSSNPTKFSGHTDDLSGHVFEMSGGPSQFPATMQRLRLYAGTTYPSTPEIVTLLDDPPVEPSIRYPGDEPTPTGPMDPNTNLPTFTSRNKRRHNKFCDEAAEKEYALEGHKIALFLVIEGQCDPVLRAHLESKSGYSRGRTEGNCLWILNEVRALISKFDPDSTYIHDAVHTALTKFYNLRQHDKTLMKYYNEFKQMALTLSANNALPLPITALNPTIAGTALGTVSGQKAIQQAQFAAHFIINSGTKFNGLRTDLREQSSRGTNQWAKTLEGAYKLLVKTEELLSNSNNRTTRTNDTPSTSTGTTGTRPGHQLHSADSVASLDPQSILLDTLATTHSVVQSDQHLQYIHDAPHQLVLHTQGGPFVSTQLATLTLFPDAPIPVWYNPDSLGNILALKDVRQVCRVTMDTNDCASMKVHTPSGRIYAFDERPDGLYVCSDVAPSDNASSLTVNSYSLVSTVRDVKQQFTARQLRDADKARTLSVLLGRPNDNVLEHCITHDHIRNCTVTADDVRRARIIYGPDIAYTKGHSTDNPTADHVPVYVPAALPQHITDHHADVVLCLDFFYVQRIPFLHCISRTLGYRHSPSVNDRSLPTMRRHLNDIINVYENRGLRIRSIHVDTEFDCLRPDFPNLHFDIVDADGHVPEVERSIRTMKEDIHTIVHGMPYRRLPKAMVTHLVSFATSNLNQLPNPGNPILAHTSPNDIVLGSGKFDCSHTHLEFGSYAQVHDTTTNTIRSRTLGSIVLTPTPSANHSYHFLSLQSGNVYTRSATQATVSPVTDIALSRLENLARLEGQPLIQDSRLLIKWRPDQPFDKDELDYDFEPPPPTNPADDDLDDSFDPSALMTSPSPAFLYWTQRHLR